MKLGRFKEIIKDCPEDYEIKISCHTKDYIIDHPEDACFVYIHEDGNSLLFEPNFSNHKYKNSIKEFNELIDKGDIPDTHDLANWDNDDFRETTIEEVLIIGDCVILV